MGNQGILYDFCGSLHRPKGILYLLTSLDCPFKVCILLQVDEDEYLELLAERTPLMLLARDQLWSPTLTMQG
jgi:hypothetical protein